MLKTVCAGFSGLLGSALVVLGALVLCYYDGVVRDVIYERMQLVPGTEMYERWRRPPVVPYLQMYFFNITNMAEFLDGGKPIVQEVGPYSYRESWEKVNITFHDNGTVEYATRKFYYFDREMSVGDESDNVTILNVPMVTAVWQVRFTARFIQLIFSSMLEVLKERPFATHSVKEFMWGYEDPLLKMARDILPPEQRLPTDSFGFFMGRNGTSDGQLNVFTGSVMDMSDYTTIDWFQQERYLTYWATDECNRIHGTDGSSYPPDVTTNTTLYIFNKSFCRSLPLVFQKHVERYGIDGYRFSPPADVFASPQEKSENQCYCLGGPPCLGGGVFNVSICQFGSPAVLSWPHFYQADRKYLDAVGGLSPDPDKHAFFVDVAPTTGTPLGAEAKLQINMALTNVSEIKPARGLRPMIFPVCWFQDGVPKMPEEVIAQLQMANNMPKVVKLTLLCVSFVLGVGLIVGGVALAVLACSGRSGSEDLDEVEPSSQAPAGKHLHGYVNQVMDGYPEKD